MYTHIYMYRGEMLLLYCIGEGGEKRQQQPPEQKNMYLYIVAVLDIYH